MITKLATNASFTYGNNISSDCYTQIETHSTILDIEDKVLFQAGFSFTTREAADKFVKNFPKYCGLRVAMCSGSIKGTLFGTELKQWPYVSFRSTKYAINEVTGDKNEAGIKKHNKIIEVLKSIGY